MAKYCDEFMRKIAPTLSEAETDEKVNQIFTLFGYIEEKDLFHRVSSAKLCFFPDVVENKLLYTYTVCYGH